MTATHRKIGDRGYRSVIIYESGRTHVVSAHLFRTAETARAHAQKAVDATIYALHRNNAAFARRAVA